MIKLSVMYPNETGVRFDMDYYVNQHLAMIRRTVGDVLKRVEVDEGLSAGAPGSEAPFRAVAHLYFESMDAFMTSFAPHAKEFSADVPNFTDLKPVRQIASSREV